MHQILNQSLIKNDIILWGDEDEEEDEEEVETFEEPKTLKKFKKDLIKTKD